jgi:hypothetical protein
MGWLKGELIDHALDALGIAPDAFNIAPEQRAKALKTLDSMMATWSVKGLAAGYLLPVSTASSNLTDDSGLPDTETEAVYQNLALKLAPPYGKTPSPELKASAKTAYDTLLIAAAQPLTQPLPNTLPVGAGNRLGNLTQPFFTEDTTGTTTGTPITI